LIERELLVNKLMLVLLLLIFILGCSAVEDNSQTQTAAATAAEVLASPTQAEPVATETAAPPTVAGTEVVETADIDAVIEYEMQGSFNFFWEQANTEEGSPGYGLIRDRFPGSPGISSIASVGFGLTAYPIGIEKGYISYEEGQERASKTLDTLLAMERVEGFYFHFVDMQTGERAWESEVSTIDTSILLMGVLTAGEYFGGEVESKAKEIYDGVNWPWFVDDSRNMFHMAYRPEEASEDQRGFAGHWDFYAEQLMLYILAAGSDTHPIDETTYYAFTRHYGKYGEGEAFIHSWFGSIFTYQYSHAWIDFREYTDREGVNWFDNSVAASLAQANFAADNAGEYNTLGPDAWGITASDGPNGYNGLYGAPPSGFDNNSHLIDDTIAPSGAIGSIIFLPQQAQQAMLNYYSIEQLKGEYGFLDAYNLTEEWYAGDVIGIDKGVSLLMLANYENDLVYQIIMANEQILNGLNRLQIEKNE
jgi:hypothetical protein